LFRLIVKGPSSPQNNHFIFVSYEMKSYILA
jgi:hypothetical protein